MNKFNFFPYKEFVRNANFYSFIVFFEKIEKVRYCIGV